MKTIEITTATTKNLTSKDIAKINGLTNLSTKLSKRHKHSWSIIKEKQGERFLVLLLECDCGKLRKTTL